MRIETNSETIKFAKNTYKELGDNVVCAALNNTPADSFLLDVFFIRGTIEHMIDPWRAIQKDSEL